VSLGDWFNDTFNPFSKLEKANASLIPQLANAQANGWNTAAEKTADSANAANHTNVNTPFGSQTYTKNPDGSYTMNLGLNGPLAGAFRSAQQQAAHTMGQPLDFGGLSKVGNGQDAMRNAFNSIYGQATSRLDPMWNQRESQSRTQLLNQGLDPNSEAFQNQMGQVGRDRNDAYQGALNNAVMGGTQAAQAQFGMDMQSRQQGLAEMLRQRSQPMQDLQGFQGLLAMPSTPQGVGTNYLGALQGMAGNNMQQQAINNQSDADAMGGLGSVLSGGLGLGMLGLKLFA
jgi:hypothetical protein